MTGTQEQRTDADLALKEWLAGAQRVVLAGIGNPFRRDDFVGVEIVRKLRDKVSEAVYLIECETVPESFIAPIVKFNPTHILLIDAGLINMKPGSTKLVNPEQLLRKSSVSTHLLPLRIFCDYLSKTTGAKIRLLVIQPKDVNFGEGLTKELQDAAKNLATQLRNLLP